jgi:hypothetical protein
MLAQLLINLSLLAFAMADETLKTTTHGNAWKYGSGGGIIGFIVLILDILVFSKFSQHLLAQLYTVLT